MPSLRAYQIPCYSHGPVFICIGRSSTPAAETTTSFSWAQRHILARRSSGGERRPCHPRPSSCTYFLPSVACVCCPPAASSSRLLLPPVVLTLPPVVLLSSPLSLGAARRRGGCRALEAGALEHLLAEGLRAVRAAVRRRKFRRLRRAQSDRGGRRMALLAPLCAAFLPSWGVLLIGTVRVVRSKMVEKFFFAGMCRSRRADSDCPSLLIFPWRFSNWGLHAGCTNSPGKVLTAEICPLPEGWFLHGIISIHGPQPVRSPRWRPWW